jgi:N-methylhydantoinase A
MGLFIGIDVGGTFTDFLVMDGGEAEVFKVLSTPQDPSIGFVDGLEKIAASRDLPLERLVPTIDRIVHGTTVTTNVVLTGTGAKTALLTTEGVRDALEMRRGIREEQYNNRYTNVPPLVPRYLRIPVTGRIGAEGGEIRALQSTDVEAACELFAHEDVEAVAVCYMNAFANDSHERATAAILKQRLPALYHSLSTDVLPSIRFYDRVSTTVLNAYVGPVLHRYLERLVARLQEQGFEGTLLIMQSNGGVVTPEAAMNKAAMTLLSGPAAGPGAGILYAGSLGIEDCITVDMGGTSFDAALIKELRPFTFTEGEINRYRLALPMMGIVTIGAGGGSIGWIDEGGLLRMGPQSAGADPGPACYGKGGEAPTCTDADLVLGYLDPDYFAGGAMPLDADAGRRAIQTRIAGPLGMSVEAAAEGMYRVINTNMAFGVREATIKRGYDPREFPMVVAGGAGPLHACMIARELEMPFFIVPRQSSIFCAAGMLMTDLEHDFVKSFVSRWDEIEHDVLRRAIEDLIAAGREVLSGEGIPEDRIQFEVAMDMRYLKQYHEVTIPVSLSSLGLDGTGGRFDAAAVLADFHREHNRLFGYSLEEEKTPVELINIRLRAIGGTDRPDFLREEQAGNADSSAAVKSRRRAFVPETGEFEQVPVYDALQLGFGAFVEGPALLEQPNTTIFVSGAFDVVVDPMGSYVVYARDKVDTLPQAVKRILQNIGRPAGAA